MNLYLLRHGTTAWNAARRIQGRTDIPLDPQGEEIARLTGAALQEQGILFRHVFSSPLSRARRTAQLVAPGVPLRTDPRLAELSFGTFEGQLVEEMKNDRACPFRFFSDDPRQYNEAMRSLESKYPESQFESLSSLCDRTNRFLRDVIDPLVLTEPADANILISGHGAMNSAFMMSILGRKDLSLFWGKGLQANCGIFIIEAGLSGTGNPTYSASEECLIFYDPRKTEIPGLL
ncbi:MAG: histidine phosphatase family protein [Blautia sp.]|nr:histidine phosphatase family protein [Blautia sp.]